MDDDTHGGALVQGRPVTCLTPKDLQRELQIGEKLCYRLLRDGAIPSVRVGGLYRIHRSELEKYGGGRVDSLAADVARFLEERGGSWSGQPTELFETLD